MSPERPIVFVLGVPRSGTTLLRLMLAGHPRLFSPPEMVLAPFETMAERHETLERRFWEKGGLRRTFIELEGLDVDAARRRVEGLRDRTVPEVYALLQAAIGERILVDKCPHLSGAPEALPRLARWFPGARYVLIVRHPAGVIRSLQNVNMAEALAATYGAPEEIWRQGNDHLRGFLATIDRERWVEVRYEDLVRDPEPPLRRVCATLGVGYEPAMARPYDGERMRTGPPGANATGDPNTAQRDRVEPELADKWLGGFDHRTVSAATKALARTLGYSLDDLPLPAVAEVDAAIEALLDTTRALEHEMRLPLELDDLEGRRFLLRVLSAAIETHTEHADHERPRWHAFIGPTRKLFGDCPDCDYLRAPISVKDGRGYRLSGRVPSGASYVGFVLHGRGGRMGAHLNSRALPLDADGRFAITIGKDEPRGPWLRCDGDETEVVARQYVVDRATSPRAELRIERLGEPAPVAPLDARAYAAGLARAGKMVREVVARVGRSYALATQLPAKRFVTVSEDSAFPTPDNTYQVCWYRFGPGHAFVVRGRLPRAAYFGLCLYNAWMESLDYTTRTVSLNHAQLRTDGEGRFTVVIAPRDPGVPNWLDSSGHEAGYVLARSLLCEGDPAELTTETVRLEDLPRPR